MENVKERLNNPAVNEKDILIIRSRVEAVEQQSTSMKRNINEMLENYMEIQSNLEDKMKRMVEAP